MRSVRIHSRQGIATKISFEERDHRDVDSCTAFVPSQREKVLRQAIETCDNGAGNISAHTDMDAAFYFFVEGPAFTCCYTARACGT